MRIKVCCENYESIPAYGLNAAQNMTYSGYKLNGTNSVSGFNTHFDRSKASIVDSQFLNDIKNKHTGFLISVDKVYLNDPLQTIPFEDHGLLLRTPMRFNKKDFVKQPAEFRKVRKIIETFFSQLYDQYNIDQNSAKSFARIATRIL